GLTLAADNTGRNFGATCFEADAFGTQSDLYPLAFENLLHRGRDFGILALDQAVRHLDHGHLAPESPVDLSELEPDVAATDDHEVARQLFERKQACVGEGGNLIDTRKIRNVCPGSHIEENSFRDQVFVTD